MSRRKPFFSFSLKQIMFVLIAPILLASCATSAPLGIGYDSLGQPIYLSSPNELQETLKKWVDPDSSYWQSDEAKIKYLVKRVRITKLRLMRNDIRYRGPQGARFLKYKRTHPRWSYQIENAQDFVSVICRGSSTSGRPYEIIFPDGSHHNFQPIMQNELNQLEAYLNR